MNGNDTDDSAMDNGAVYVLARCGSVWAQPAYVKASNIVEGDVFS